MVLADKLIIAAIILLTVSIVFRIIFGISWRYCVEHSEKHVKRLPAVGINIFTFTALVLLIIVMQL